MADESKGKRPHVDWRCVEMRGGNLAGMNLRNADLRAGNFAGCNFTGCDLSYADFRGANVQGAIFQNATLYGAKLQGAAAHQADFRGADLRMANLAGAYMEGAKFPPPERTPWPSEVAKANREKQKEQADGLGWAERIERRRKGNQDDNATNDQSQRERGRSLPDEQREKERDRGHSL